MCKKEPLECSYPPCRVKFSCAPAWPYHHLPNIPTGGGKKQSAGPSATAARAVSNALGGAFNVFNGFSDKVANAFIAGRTGGAGGAGSQGVTGEESAGASDGSWRPFASSDNGGSLNDLNSYNGFNGFSGGHSGTGGHSSNSHGQSSGNTFNVPVSHAAGAVGTLSSEGGSVAGEAEATGKKSGQKPEGEAVEEEGDKSDSDDEDEEEPDESL